MNDEDAAQQEPSPGKALGDGPIGAPPLKEEPPGFFSRNRDLVLGAGLVGLGAGITLFTYTSTAPGGTYILATGPSLFGLGLLGRGFWSNIRSAPSRGRRAGWIGVATLTAVLLLAAGGLMIEGLALPGSDRGDFLSRVEFLCEEANREHLTITVPSESASAETFTTYVEETNTVERRLLAKLQALDPPAEDARDVAAILDAIDASLDEAEESVLQARAGDLDAADASLATAERLAKEADRLAIDHGFPCGGPEEGEMQGS